VESKGKCLSATTLCAGRLSRLRLGQREHGIITVPEFRAAFDSQCPQIELEEKSHQTVELQLISKESMDAEAKIP